MGSSSSRIQQELNIDLRDWQKVGGQYSPILRNRRSGQQGQIVQTVLDPSSKQKNQLQIYYYRKKNDQALVKTFGAQIEDGQSKGLCGKSKIAKVIVEPIVKRYSDLPQIPLGQSLYAMSESLRGYRQYFNKQGHTDITARMIGVTPKGNVKVWINQNFASNHPNFERSELQITNKHNEDNYQSTTEQMSMIQSITRIIQSKNQKGSFPPQLKNKLMSSTSFQNAYSRIQQFSSTRSIFVPGKINLLQDNTSGWKNNEAQNLQRQSNFLQRQSVMNQGPIIQQRAPQVSHVQNMYSPPARVQYRSPPPRVSYAQTNLVRNSSPPSVLMNSAKGSFYPGINLPSYHPNQRPLNVGRGPNIQPIKLSKY